MTDRTADVQGCLDHFASIAADEAAASFKNEWEWLEIDPDNTSPIEQMLSIALFYAIESSKHFGPIGENVFGQPGRAGIQINERVGFRVRPQVPIGAYRADFLLTYRHYTGAGVAAVIECDGHNFHEKTKEQAQRDKERDRHFQSLGLLVLRYSGSEIYRDPLKCALDALNIVWTRAIAAGSDDNA